VEKETKSTLIKYLVCLCVAISMTFVVLLIQGLFTTKGLLAKDVMKIFHNAFFTSGAFLMLFSGLLYVAGEGAFLGVGYAMGRAVKALLPFLGRADETYAEYRERKTGKKKSGSKLCILLVGAGFFLISMIFLIVYYQV
jgi:hypothetical protein